MGMPDHEQERERIAQAYARRDGQGKPQLYAWHRQDALYSAYRCRSQWARALHRAGLVDLSQAEMLDVGCGQGDWLRMVLEWGGRAERLHGIDLLPDRIAKARELSPPGMDLRVECGWELPYPDGRFDLCAASTVFSSILDHDWQKAVAREMARVLRPGGWVMVFDYAVSDPKNPDTMGVGRGTIKKLFPDLRLARTARLLLPAPLLRRWPARALGLAHALESILPLLCTHRLYQLTK